MNCNPWHTHIIPLERGMKCFHKLTHHYVDVFLISLPSISISFQDPKYWVRADVVLAAVMCWFWVMLGVHL